MRRLFRIVTAGWLSSCAAPEKALLTPATSQATAVVQLAQEFELLVLVLEATTGPALVTIELAPRPPATGLAKKAEAAAMLRESPDLINKMMAFEPGNPLVSRAKQQPEIKQRLLYHTIFLTNCPSRHYQVAKNVLFLASSVHKWPSEVGIAGVIDKSESRRKKS